MLRVFCAPRCGAGSAGGSADVYSLLEYAFMTEYGGNLPEIKKTPNGKPFFPGRPDVHFSLSHSATHVLCALSDGPVGADIESPRIISGRAIQYFCSPEERSLFDPLDLWVLKESYIKLVGGMLPLVKSIRFSFENGRIITKDRSSVSMLYRIGVCRAAVSIHSGDLPDSIEVVR